MKRLLTLLVPLLVGGVSFAQNLAPGGRQVPLPEGFIAVDPESIPMSDAIWAFLLVHSSVTGWPFMQLRQYGLDETSAAALVRHVQISIEARNKAALAARAVVCRNREQITTREDLARAYERIKTASDDVRATAVARVPAIVGAQAYARIVVASAELRLRMGGMDVDWPTLLATEPASAVPERIERMCSRAAEANYMRRRAEEV